MENGKGNVGKGVCPIIRCGQLFTTYVWGWGQRGELGGEDWGGGGCEWSKTPNWMIVRNGMGHTLHMTGGYSAGR